MPPETHSERRPGTHVSQVPQHATMAVDGLPAPASPHAPHLSSRRPSRAAGSRAWPWARPAGMRAAKGGAPEPGMWGARPLAELSPRGPVASAPTSGPSLRAPIGRPRPTGARSRPPPSRMETWLGSGRPERGGG